MSSFNQVAGTYTIQEMGRKWPWEFKMQTG